MGLFREFFQKPILKITKKYDTATTKLLETGDIVLFRTDKSDIAGAGISLFTDSPYTHAEIYVEDGWEIGATTNGVGFNNAVDGPDIFDNKCYLDILRVKSGLSDEQKHEIIFQAYKQLAKPYDYAGLLTGSVWPTKNSYIQKTSYKAFMCAEMVDFLYKQIKLPLSSNASTIVAPADIAHSSVLEYKFSVYNGILRTDKASLFDKLDPEVQIGNWNGFAEFIVNFVMKPTSSRDEFYASLNKMSTTVKQRASQKIHISM